MQLSRVERAQESAVKSGSVDTLYKILITDGLEQSGLSALSAAAHVDDRSGISPTDLLQILPEYDALIVRSRTRVTAGLLQAAPRLKVVGRPGVGVDNIDLQAAQAHGLIVVNTPVATTQAVAELVIGLIFSLARAIPQADSSMKNGKWLKKELIGAEIGGKTLGVLGMGQIGASVAEKAAGLGMTIIGYDAFLSDDQIARRGARPVDLDELYASSDYITIHTPLTDQTRGLIDGEAISKLKPGVRLVCTARGGIIAEEALLAALDGGRIAGAALDVYENEPPGATPLVCHPNLIATPHIGAQTVEAQRRAAVDVAEEVLAALEGRPLRWRVI